MYICTYTYTYTYIYVCIYVDIYVDACRWINDVGLRRRACDDLRGACRAGAVALQGAARPCPRPKCWELEPFLGSKIF